MCACVHVGGCSPLFTSLSHVHVFPLSCSSASTLICVRRWRGSSPPTSVREKAGPRIRWGSGVCVRGEIGWGTPFDVSWAWAKGCLAAERMWWTMSRALLAVSVTNILLCLSLAGHAPNRHWAGLHEHKPRGFHWLCQVSTHLLLPPLLHVCFLWLCPIAAPVNGVLRPWCRSYCPKNGAALSIACFFSGSGLQGWGKNRDARKGVF